MSRPHDVLEDKSPLLAAKSEFGVSRVRSILIAIQHGVVV